MTLPFSNLANPDRDRELIPCPGCDAEYNIPGRRPGPTCITFSERKHGIVCLSCWRHGLPGKTQDEAIDNYNAGKIKINIKKRREALGLTINEVSKIAGVGPASWKEWESGKRSYTEYSRRKIARALGVEMGSL